MKPKRLFLCTALLLILAACLWYTRPMTLQQLCPDLPLDQVTGVSGWYRIPGPEAELQAFHLDQDQTDTLLTLVTAQTFRRSLANFLPQGNVRFASGIIPFDSDGDFSWIVNFEWRDEPIPGKNGNGHTGALLELEDFYGELTVQPFFSQKYCEVRSPNFSQWRYEVFSIITEGENKP